MAEKPKYRLTGWPDRLPHPKVLRRRYELTSDRRAIVEVPDEAPTVHDDCEGVILSGEIYLRLRQVPLHDPDAILAFVNEFGLLGIRSHGFSAIEGTPAAAAMAQGEGCARVDLVRRELREVASLHPRNTTVGADVWAYDPPRAESLAEFRFGAEWIADLTNLWIVANPKSPTKQKAELKDSKPLRRPLESPAWRVLSPLLEPCQAAHTLVASLEPALRPFHPRLLMRSEYGSGDPNRDQVVSRDASGKPLKKDDAASVDFVGAALISVCALELFNHVIDKNSYQRCVSETCGRLFVRQSGRSRHGQHRTSGVRYCSPRCSAAQGQRDRRARQPVPRRNPGASKRP